MTPIARVSHVQTEFKVLNVFLLPHADVKLVHHLYKVKVKVRPAPAVVEGVTVLVPQGAGKKAGPPCQVGAAAVAEARRTGWLTAAPARHTLYRRQIHRNQRHRMHRIEPLANSVVHTPQKVTITFTGEPGSGKMCLQSC